MDDYSWAVPPEPPYIFSLSATPSEDLNGSPQKQPGLHVAAPTFVTENLPNDTQNPYMPCDAASPPSATNSASHVFNLSQISSANASVLPPAGKALPMPPFTFGDIQSSFSFNVNEFWPLLGYDDHSSTSDLSSMPDPIAAPGDELSPSLDNRAANPVSETCSPLQSLRLHQAVERNPKLRLCRGSLGLLADHLVPVLPKNPSPPKMRAMTIQYASDDHFQCTRYLFICGTKTLLQCCMMVKPESLARHMMSDGHKRNAGLPTDRPEVCTTCNIA